MEMKFYLGHECPKFYLSAHLETNKKYCLSTKQRQLFYGNPGHLACMFLTKTKQKRSSKCFVFSSVFKIIINKFVWQRLKVKG